MRAAPARTTSRAPKKRLGQHFLTAPAYARRIAESVPAQPDDVVVEIGPGTGALSAYLAERFSRLHLVERDPDVLPRLREKLAGHTYTLHEDDARSFDYGNLDERFHAVGNLPYGVAAVIMRKVLTCAPQVISCTFMVQREVAERIVAQPHTKRNGFLSIFCQFFGTPHIAVQVPPGAFFPRPRVDSSVFVITVDPAVEERLPRDRWDAFFTFVDRGYSMRRKKLTNPLKSAWPEVNFIAALTGIGLREDCRAEDLSVDDWLRLFRESFG
jgi:16S rRNA (adenine1518-N6/adenine1519-N6)-dimethyltransferase